jgi:hypothetical protein
MRYVAWSLLWACAMWLFGVFRNWRLIVAGRYFAFGISLVWLLVWFCFCFFSNSKTKAAWSGYFAIDGPGLFSGCGLCMLVWFVTSTNSHPAVLRNETLVWYSWQTPTQLGRWYRSSRTHNFDWWGRQTGRTVLVQTQQIKLHTKLVIHHWLIHSSICSLLPLINWWINPLIHPFIPHHSIP